MDPVGPVDLRPPPLGRDAVARIHGMLVAPAPEDRIRVDPVGQVERDAQLAVGGQRLQSVHVVGDLARAVTRVEVVVPARRRRPAARQQRAIGVEHDIVALIGDGAEQLVLAVRRVREQAQCLVGVRGHHHAVVALGLAALRRQQNVIGLARYRPHRGGDANAVAERPDQGLDVAVRAPATVRHRGRSRKLSMPWLAKNWTRKRAGKDHICSGSEDHTAAAWGTISLSTNGAE